MVVKNVGQLKGVSHPVVCSAVLSQTKNWLRCSCTTTPVGDHAGRDDRIVFVLQGHRAPRAVLRLQHPIQVPSLPEKGQPNPEGLPGRKFPVAAALCISQEVLA